MKSKVFCAALMLVFLFAGTTQADVWYPFAVESVAMDYNDAVADAMSQIDDVVEAVESVHPGQSVTTVVFAWDWDQPILRVEFWVVVGPGL